MKTPDQIADELLTAHEEATGEIAHVPATLNDDDLRVWMVDAIEADRARRAADPHTIERFTEVWESYDGDVSYLVSAWERREYIPERIAELTREWEAATGDTASDYAYLSVDDWVFGLFWDEAEEIARLIEWQGVATGSDGC